MAVLQKLAFISVLLNLDLLKLKQFNDLCLLYRHMLTLGSNGVNYTLLDGQLVWDLYIHK